MSNKKSNSRNLYDEVTNSIIDLLNDSLTYEQPWLVLDSNGELAHNLASKKRYNGVNQILLSYRAFKRNYQLNSWLTFNNVVTMGGNVRKGEKSTMIYFYKFLYMTESGKKVHPNLYDKMNDKQKSTIKKIPYLKYYNVFNVFQTENLAPAFYEVITKEPMPIFERDNAAEELINSTDAKIIYIPGNDAFYRPDTDEIQLPLREQFIGKDHFYSTALHELAHWTGHRSRLNRLKKDKFGSPDYAFEELIAELSAAYLCSHLGFTKTITNNAAYIKSWIKVLQNDNKMIFKAAKSAEQASEFIKQFKAVETV